MFCTTQNLTVETRTYFVTVVNDNSSKSYSEVEFSDCYLDSFGYSHELWFWNEKSLTNKHVIVFAQNEEDSIFIDNDVDFVPKIRTLLKIDSLEEQTSCACIPVIREDYNE